MIANILGVTIATFVMESIRLMNFKGLPAPTFNDFAILSALNKQEKQSDLLSYYSKSGKNDEHSLLTCMYVFLC